MPGPAVVGREDAWKVFARGKQGPAEPAYGLARDAPVPAEPTAALLLPTASVIYGRGGCFAGPFPEGGEGCPGLPGARSRRAGIAGSIDGNRGSGSTVWPSHLDLPPEKVKCFKVAQGDDLVNGCVTQVLPCGVGFFVSLILLFTPVGNHWGWGWLLGSHLHSCISTVQALLVTGVRNAVSLSLSL